MSAIRRVPKKKRSQSARAFRPAPWNYSPEKETRGLRHFNATWMESEELLQSRPSWRVASDRGLRTGVYKNDLWAGDHLTPGHQSMETQRRLTKYRDSMNMSTESADIPRQSHREGRCMTARQPDQSELPWRSPYPWPHHLETEDGKLRGHRHMGDKHLKSEVQLPHDNDIKPKPKRTHGKSLSHEAKVMSCFEQSTLLRNRSSNVPAAEHRLRSPFGTEHNYIRHEPIRKHTVHYDTRELLTYC